MARNYLKHLVLALTPSNHLILNAKYHVLVVKSISKDRFEYTTKWYQNKLQYKTLDSLFLRNPSFAIPEKVKLV